MLSQQPVIAVLPVTDSLCQNRRSQGSQSAAPKPTLAVQVRQRSVRSQNSERNTSFLPSFLLSFRYGGGGIRRLMQRHVPTQRSSLLLGSRLKLLWVEPAAQADRKVTP
jgi:hypothetical protein